LQNLVKTLGQFVRRIGSQPFPFYQATTQWDRRLLVLAGEIKLAHGAAHLL
jgi:hypothetical protein